VAPGCEIGKREGDGRGDSPRGRAVIARRLAPSLFFLIGGGNAGVQSEIAGRDTGQITGASEEPSAIIPSDRELIRGLFNSVSALAVKLMGQRMVIGIDSGTGGYMSLHGSAGSVRQEPIGGDLSPTKRQE
jgi:hypothetical protein